MPVRFSQQTFFFISLLILPFVLPSAISVDSCQAQEIQTFGESPSKSKDGVNGQNGVDSQSITIFADGSQTTLDLSGGEGSPGENGEAGADAICEQQPLDVPTNLKGAEGGDGGDAGDGGNGGHGGDLTIYVTDRADLKQIYVLSPGGRGGDPGQGGPGGAGCQCAQPFWTIQTCTGSPGTPGHRCTSVEYQCFDGETGRNGRNGAAGRDGNPGSLTLINSNRPLVEDQGVATVSMSELQQRGFILSRNHWETRTGAAELFAPGSIIADQYLELVERLENSVLLIWNAPQSFSNFADQPVTLELLENNEIKITVPDEIWLEATTVQQNNITEFLVFNAFLKEDVIQFKSEGLSGSGTDLQLTVVDAGAKSDLVNTQFSLRYRTTPQGGGFLRNRDYRTRFEDKIPPELISYQNNRFVFSLGELPIEAEFLTPGTNVEIELTILRSFQDKSAEQTLVIRETINR